MVLSRICVELSNIDIETVINMNINKYLINQHPTEYYQISSKTKEALYDIQTLRQLLKALIYKLPTDFELKLKTIIAESSEDSIFRSYDIEGCTKIRSLLELSRERIYTVTKEYIKPLNPFYSIISSKCSKVEEHSIMFNLDTLPKMQWLKDYIISQNV